MGGCSQYRGKVASFESPWVQRPRRVKSTPADSSDSSSVSRSRKEAGAKIVHGRVRLRAGRSANAPIPHTVAASFLEVRYVPRVDVHLCQVCVGVAKGVPAACCCCLCQPDIYAYIPAVGCGSCWCGGFRIPKYRKSFFNRNDLRSIVSFKQEGTYTQRPLLRRGTSE